MTASTILQVEDAYLPVGEIVHVAEDLVRIRHHAVIFAHLVEKLHQLP